MADESFKVRCVLVNGEADASDPMTEAFKTLDTQGFKPEWYTEANCLEVTQKEKNCAYIFDPFEGEAFSYISSLGCRILGPQCILTALHYKMEIPRKRIPVYNLAMKNVVVSCTSMERQERDQIYHQVELMGGMGSKDFTEEVTHLIAKEVGSRKYEVAISLGKQVMLPQWVQAVWNIAKLRHIHATDGQFEKYKCQIFLGLVICVSGLDTKERKEVKKLVEQEGGKYSGEMKLNHCTHLIINEPQGQKYEFAKRWNLMIVRSEWIYDCIEKGHYIKETDYIVNNNRGSGSLQTSTPEKEHGQGGVSCLADISSISNISMAHISHVNDTAIQNNTTRQSVIDVDPIVLLDVTQAPAGLYLDGCKIFLSGFQGTALEKVRKLINTGGGTRFNSINESVTHVVMSDSTEKSISALKLGNFRPHVVTSSWLVECFRKGHTVDEDLYRSVELPPLESCSPKIKSKRKSEVISKPKQPLITEPVTEPPQEEMNDIMSQYLPQPDQGITHSGDTTVVEQLPSHIDFDEDMTQEPDDKCQDNIEENGIFGKKTFMFFGFEEEAVKTLTEYINEVGGKVLSGHSRTVPNYGIVPIDGFQVERTVQEVVTNAWLQMCIEQETVLDVASNELFTPVEIVGGAMPLTACVISISGYSGAERDCLMHIAEILGAMCQEFLVRNRNKGFEPNTHLIVKQPEGSKYAAAKKWGLFIVSKSWLFACAKVGEKLCESKYPVVASTDELEAQGNMDIQTEPQNRKQNNKVPIIQGPTPSTSAETRTNSNHGPMEVEITKTEEKSVPCVKGSRHSSHGAMEVDNGQTEEKSEPSKEIKMLTPNPAQNEMKQKVLKHTDSKEILQLAGVNSSIGVKELPKNNKISGDSQKENKSIKKRASHPVSVDEKTDQTHPLNHNRVTKQRRSKKHNNSGQLETSGTSAVDSSEVEAEKRLTKQADRESNSVPEPSQSLQVTWDDPTGRLEQEKLAHKLERAFSPTQEVDTMTGMGFEEDAQFSDEEQIQLPDLPENIHSNPPPAELEERTPTPDAPKLAFPMPKKPREQLSPEPVNIVEEAHPQIKDKNVSYVFILSGMSQEERDDYGALVEQLGGKMLELQNYDPQCTHLVVGTPARNEKFLASVAAGKWVLHKSYFEACRQEKGFVKEDFYEWGGDGTESLLQTLSPQVVRLAGAAYRWRRKIQQEKKKNPKCPGAFGGWDVVLCTDRNKEGNFRRLLVAGGANVLPLKPPFNKSVSATHAFLEPNKMPVTQEDIECLLSSDVLCLRPDFIAAHLTDNPVPKDYHPPEVSSIMKRSSKASTTTSKRKSGLSSSNTSQNKRSKKC
ncbi:hypothetical protein ScPMuIL_012404 [Solemya velum]